MVVGFNHNFRYKGELYHVQTEDSGVRNPHIVTLLYTGGTIIASKKSTYVHLLQSDKLEKLVEETMKAQHREMLRRLRDGELDELIRKATRGEVANAPSAPLKPAPAPAAAKLQDPPPAKAPNPPAAQPVAPAAVSRPAPLPPPAVVPAPAPAPTPQQERVVEVSLDELILSYLAGEDNR